MEKTVGVHGDIFMIAMEKKLIPREILKDSVLVHLAAAYLSRSSMLGRF